MAYGLSNSYVTDDVTWPPKVLWGSTVGYPSASLTSCFYIFFCLPGISKAVTFDGDSDDEWKSIGVVVWRVERTAIVTGVRRLNIFDDENSTGLDSEASGRRVVRQLYHSSASRPDHQPVWWVVLDRTVDATRETAGYVGATRWSRGDQTPGRRVSVCPWRAGRRGTVHHHHNTTRHQLTQHRRQLNLSINAVARHLYSDTITSVHAYSGPVC